MEEGDELKVLDYDEDGYQMDLGALKSLNKRQASKTEAYSSLTSAHHWKNKKSQVYH